MEGVVIDGWERMCMIGMYYQLHAKVYRFWSLRERVQVSASTIRFAKWHKIFLSILGSSLFCIGGMLLGFDLFYEKFLLITPFSRTPEAKRNSSKNSFMIPVSLAEFKT